MHESKHVLPGQFVHSVLVQRGVRFRSVPELDMHESKHFLPGQFVHSEEVNIFIISQKHKPDTAL
jgi:hypothetical protein